VGITILIGILIWIFAFVVPMGFILFVGAKFNFQGKKRYFIEEDEVGDDSPDIIDELKDVKSIEDALELADGVIDSIIAEDESIDREKAYNKHTMSADFIDDMIDIEGEPIIYRFKEATNAGKEVVNGISIYISMFVTAIILFFPIILDMMFPLVYQGVNVSVMNAFNLIILIAFGFVLVDLIKRLNSKNTKHHYSWAISENYFIQVLAGTVDIGFDKKDIWHVENTGTELIFSLNIRNPIITNSSSELYDRWDEDKFVMEDVINIDEVYDILRDWLGQTGY